MYSIRHEYAKIISLVQGKYNEYISRIRGEFNEICYIVWGDYTKSSALVRQVYNEWTIFEQKKYKFVLGGLPRISTLKSGPRSQTSYTFSSFVKFSILGNKQIYM